MAARRYRRARLCSREAIAKDHLSQACDTRPVTHKRTHMWKHEAYRIRGGHVHASGCVAACRERTWRLGLSSEHSHCTEANWRLVTDHCSAAVMGQDSELEEGE